VKSVSRDGIEVRRLKTCLESGLAWLPQLSRGTRRFD
jgi:hypothetical protein